VFLSKTMYNSPLKEEVFMLSKDVLRILGITRPTLSKYIKEGIIRYMQSENAEDLLNTVRALINHYPKETLDCLMNILGTHDTARILTVLGGIYCANKEEMASPKAKMSEKAKEEAIKKLKMATLLQYTLPGVPCVYYGDENAMEGHSDPFCRRCFDWTNLNEDLIGFYKKLGAIRKEHFDFFKDGLFQEVYVDCGLIIFARKKENKNIFVFTNNSSKRYYLALPQKMIELLSKNVFEQQLEIQPYSYGILKTI